VNETKVPYHACAYVVMNDTCIHCVCLFLMDGMTDTVALGQVCPWHDGYHFGACPSDDCDHVHGPLRHSQRSWMGCEESIHPIA
jgi:hypothetical protein